jgi:hypothetical protein
MFGMSAASHCREAEFLAAARVEFAFDFKCNQTTNVVFPDPLQDRNRVPKFDPLTQGDAQRV